LIWELWNPDLGIVEPEYGNFIHPVCAHPNCTSGARAAMRFGGLVSKRSTTRAEDVGTWINGLKIGSTTKNNSMPITVNSHIHVPLFPNLGSTIPKSNLLNSQIPLPPFSNSTHFIRKFISSVRKSMVLYSQIHGKKQ